MLSLDTKKFLEKSFTQNFLNAARHFIELLETKDIEKELFYPNVHTALLELYSAGHKLDVIKLTKSVNTNFDDLIKFDAKNAKLIAVLGQDVLYWEIFDPTSPEFPDDNVPVQCSLDIDFDDIYHDLKTELFKIDNIGTDEAIEDALWQLKFSFTNHWGNHCINALRALHYLYYDGKANEYQE